MNMLMVICPEARQEEVRELIARHDVHAYSEIAGVLGEGKTGKKLGDRFFPEKSVLIFTVVPEPKQAELVAALRDCAKRLFPGEGMRVFALPAESLV